MKPVLAVAFGLVALLLLPALAPAGGTAGARWNAAHLPSPAPGYLPKQYPASVDPAAWSAEHLPSPAPGYLPRTTLQPVAIVRIASTGFRYRDAAIGAAVGALGLALIGGAVLIGTREREFAAES